jgi:hypothetical protein
MCRRRRNQFATGIRARCISGELGDPWLRRETFLYPYAALRDRSGMSRGDIDVKIQRSAYLFSVRTQQTLPWFDRPSYLA